MARERLDRAVLNAYGWPDNLSDAELLERLFALNRERAEAEARAGGQLPLPEPAVVGKSALSPANVAHRNVIWRRSQCFTTSSPPASLILAWTTRTNARSAASLAPRERGGSSGCTHHLAQVLGGVLASDATPQQVGIHPRPRCQTQAFTFDGQARGCG